MHDVTLSTGHTGDAHSIKRKGEYRMSMVKLRGRRWAALVVTAVLGLTSIAHAQTSQERRLRQLEQELERTQVEMKQLRKEIDQQKAVTRASEEQVQHAADTADVAKAKASKVPDWLNSFTPFGDVRFRYEGFFNQPRLADQVVTANNRLRVRARVGMRFAYSDEVAATFRLASGNINDPISTNQTLTGNFTPFSVNLDWAYLTLAPGKTFDIRPGLFTLNAGKFPNPMFKVGELVFDDDLSPEGFNEIVALLDSPVGDPQSVSLDQVKLYGEQWTFSQINNRQDGFMFGGQINPQHALRLGPGRGGSRPVRMDERRPDRPGDQPEHHRLHGVGRAGRELELQLHARQHQPDRGEAHPATHAKGEGAARGLLRHDRVPEQLQPDELQLCSDAAERRRGAAVAVLLRLREQLGSGRLQQGPRLASRPAARTGEGAGAIGRPTRSTNTCSRTPSSPPSRGATSASAGTNEKGPVIGSTTSC